jgi:formate hydrogenlyase subunit 4
VFRIFPSVVLAAVFLAALLVPVAGHRSVLAFEGDFLVFAMALGLATFFGLVGAMDVGSSFEGMGASREATFTSLVEVAFFVIAASLAGLSGHFTLQSIFGFFGQGEQLVVLTGILSVVALFLMLLIEGCRVPIDDPETHLELTMIHEVMILDNSGPDLAYLQYASSLKMVVFGMLIINLLLPPGLVFWQSAGLVLAGQGLLSVAVGTLESLIARARLKRLPEFIFVIVSAALIVFFCLLLYSYRGVR